MPDPESARHFLERLRQESPAAFERIASSPRRAALRRQPSSPTAAFSPNPCCATRSACCKLPRRAASPRASRWRITASACYEFSRRRACLRRVDFARFRRRQLLRILLRDVLGAGHALRSHRGAVQPGRRHPRRRLPPHPRRACGAPRRAAPGRTARPCGFSVISLGKLGGKELNYSSDIDLMFVYGGNGETDGPARAHQQGVLQEGRQPVHRAALHLHRRGPVLPRGPAPAARRTLRRGLHLARRRARLLQRARPRLGAADADQGARLGRRARARRARCWSLSSR